MGVHKNGCFSQAVNMRKIKTWEEEGKSREERESCFPKMGGEEGKNIDEKR